MAIRHSYVSASKQDCVVLPKRMPFTQDQHSMSLLGISGQSNKSSFGDKFGEGPRAWDGLLSVGILLVFFLLL